MLYFVGGELELAACKTLAPQFLWSLIKSAATLRSILDN